LPTERGDGETHGQIVAYAAQQFGGNHGSSEGGRGARGHPCPRPASKVDEVGLLLPVRLQQHAVDIVDVDGLVRAADGLDQTANAQVARLAQDAVGGADDQVDGGRREGVVAQADAVELTQDEVAQGVGPQAFGEDRVGDAALDVLVDAQVQRRQQRGSANEDEI